MCRIIRSRSRRQSNVGPVCDRRRHPAVMAVPFHDHGRQLPPRRAKASEAGLDHLPPECRPQWLRRFIVPPARYLAPGLAFVPLVPTCLGVGGGGAARGSEAEGAFLAPLATSQKTSCS